MNSLIKYLKNGFTNPKKTLRYIYVYLKYLFRRNSGTLIFIGMDTSGAFSLLHRGYKICYGFEANPERFAVLNRKYSKFQNIKLFNVAITTYDGEIEFNISSNNMGASSSVGNFNEEWIKKNKSKNIEMIKTIKVPCINLLNFCKVNNIHIIDDYISDIQGMDLEVLKTLSPMIKNKMINSITCEVTKNDKINIYHDLPDNSENGFNKLLKDNYKLAAKGSGLLIDNTFESISKDAWEYDCKWKLINT